MIEKINEKIFSTIQYFIPRLLLSKISWGDIVISTRDISELDCQNPLVFWQKWLKGWNSRATHYEEMAADCLTKNNTVSSDEYLQMAAGCYHWAEFMFFQDAEQKEISRKKVTACFEKSIATQHHSIKKITIPFNDIEMPGYFMTPESTANPPCVILINGLDSAKEIELFMFANQFKKRGIATVIFDGPGQGLLAGKVPLNVYYERAVDAILHYANKNLAINHDKIGLFGVSFGGFLAMRAATFLQEKITACINLSGGFDLENFDRINTRIQEDFRYTFMQEDISIMSDIATQEITLKNTPKYNKALLCIHGAHDSIFPFINCEKVKNWATGKADFIIYPDEAHVCQNHFNNFIPTMCDWMKEKLS